MREKLKPLAHGMTFNFNKQILLTRIGSNLIYSLASYARICKYDDRIPKIKSELTGFYNFSIYKFEILGIWIVILFKNKFAEI